MCQIKTGLKLAECGVRIHESIAGSLMSPSVAENSGIVTRLMGQETPANFVARPRAWSASEILTHQIQVNRKTDLVMRLAKMK